MSRAEVSALDIAWWSGDSQAMTQQKARTICERLYPLMRTSVGPSIRETLQIVSELIPLSIVNVPTGTSVGDWSIPDEWEVHRASITDANGRCWIDLRENSLHVVNGSIAVDQTGQLSDFASHLHTDPRHPNAIPYRTSYYSPHWGFCLSRRQLEAMRAADDGRPWRFVIHSNRKPGALSYGELFITGSETEEILFSAHACHPGLANDNVSGMVVAIALAQYLLSRPRRYSYRFLFGPGTIGPIAWSHLSQAAHRVVLGGCVLAMVGDSQPLSYKQSRVGNSLFDQALRISSLERGEAIQWTSFSPEGYDERQFNSASINLPIGRLFRADWRNWPAYHCSLDNLRAIDIHQLRSAFEAIANAVDCLETLPRPTAVWGPGEPQLGRHGLWNSPDRRWSDQQWRESMGWITTLADGSRSPQQIALESGCEGDLIERALQELLARGLLSEGLAKRDSAEHQRNH